MFLLLKQLWRNISPKHRLQFYALLLLQMVNAIAEMLSIGLAIPFLMAVNNPKIILNDKSLSYFIDLFGVDSNEQMLLIITICFLGSVIASGVIRYLTLRFSTNLTFRTGMEIGFRMYELILKRPYAFHIEINTSKLINSIMLNADRVVTALNSVTIIIGSLAIIIGVISVLLLIDPLITISSIMIFGFLYFLIAVFVKRSLEKNSFIINIKGHQIIQTLQESFGGIRDVILCQAQYVFTRKYQEIEQQRRLALSENVIISNSPRIFFDVLGMLVIAIFAIYLVVIKSDNMMVFPILGTIALSAQRLLPVLQQTYHAWSTILATQASLSDSLNVLELKKEEILGAEGNISINKVSFQKEIEFKHVYFKYQSSNSYAITNLNLKISKGEVIGIIGETGSGKSTFIDLLMGLLTPSSGTISIDGELLQNSNLIDWMNNISHVPQDIYMSEMSVAENIAFGVLPEKINILRVKEVSSIAEIASDIESWKGGYDTSVGERGVRLSGGQKQRIAVARALYRDANILIFDEATSALDGETERLVIENINNKRKGITIIMVAHRISTLHQCSRILRFTNGIIVEETNYQDLQNSL